MENCQICNMPLEMTEVISMKEQVYNLCHWCKDRVKKFIDGNISHSVINIPWGSNLGYSCWSTIRDFIRKHNIKEVLEYGTGLSTELFVIEGVHVTSLEMMKYNHWLYNKHEWLNNERANVVGYGQTMPLLERTWDFVFVDGQQDRAREVEHAMKHASRFLMLHDPGMGEEAFFPNDDWQEVEHKIWERKVPLVFVPPTEEMKQVQVKFEPATIQGAPQQVPKITNITFMEVKDTEDGIPVRVFQSSNPAPSVYVEDQILTNKEPSRFAFVVSACSKYIPELCACLNSLDYVGNKEDVYVLGYKLPKSFTDQFNNLGYKVTLYDIPEPEARQFGGESEILCRKRYWYAAGYGQSYDAVCILDADMYFCRNVWQYFEIAAKTGFILGASLEQKRVYGAIEHHKVRGKHLLPEPVWNDKDICCAPMFVDMKKYGDLFRECWMIFADGFPEDNFKAPDMESYNLLLLAKKMTDQVILLPNYSWVATNEKLLKPYTRVTTQRDGNLWTESGEPIFIVHGQFYKLKWRRNQLESRHGCALGYVGCADNCDNMANGALNCLWEKFRQMLDYKMTVDKVAYTATGDPGDKLI